MPVDCDVVVVGGGPAGLATGIAAAEAGMSVRLVEPKVHPIDKPCGEGLMPHAVASLRALGVSLPAGQPLRGIGYVCAGDAVFASFAAGSGRGVRRTALSAAMWARAQEVGVVRVADRMRELVQGPDTVRVSLAAGAPLEAAWVVAADGPRSPTRRLLGLEAPRRLPLRLGVRRHFHAPEWGEAVEVHWAPSAEAYVTPVGEGEVGVAILFAASARPAYAPGGLLEALLGSFPALQRRLGAPTSAARGAGPFEQRTTERRRGRVLLVGDAAGFLDPITGEGVRLGVEAGRAAVAALVSGRPEAYETAWRRLWARYALATGALLRLTAWQPGRAALVPTLRRAPWIMRGALGVLEG